IKSTAKSTSNCTLKPHLMISFVSRTPSERQTSRHCSKLGPSPQALLPKSLPMASFVRLTVQLQQLALCLSGLILSCLLSIYLIAWATDPPGLTLNLIAGGLLVASVVSHGVAHTRAR